MFLLAASPSVLRRRQPAVAPARKRPIAYRRKRRTIGLSQRYTDDQREAFLDLARELGPGAARRKLGYPAERTARGWTAAVGLDLTHAVAQQQGRALQQAFSDEEWLHMWRGLAELSLSEASRRPTLDNLVKASLVLGRAMNASMEVQQRHTRAAEPVAPNSRQIELLRQSIVANERVMRQLEAGGTQR